MKKILTILFSVLIFNGFSQNNSNPMPDNKFDLMFGTGVTFLGTGDYLCLTFENELNYKLSSYFTTSAVFNMGKSLTGASDGSASFFEGNLNLFISPFRNNRLNNFRIGAGISVFNVNDTYLSSSYYCECMTCNEYIVDKHTTFGGSFILEDFFRIGRQFFIGAKVFLKPYVNGDINSGAMAKFGIRL
jgi:hypothetical protein